MVNSIITYTLSMHSPPFIPPQAGGRGGGIGIIGVENPSYSVQIIVTFTIVEIESVEDLQIGVSLVKHLHHPFLQ